MNEDDDKIDGYEALRADWLNKVRSKPDRWPGFHQEMAVLAEFSLNVERHASSNHLSTAEFFQHLQEVRSLTERLRFCFVDYGSEEKSKPKPSFWIHRKWIANELGADRDPYINSESLEQLVEDYVRQPVRSPSFERLVAEGLTSAEIFAFSATVLVTPKWHNLLGTSRIRGLHVVPATLLNIFFNVLVIGGLAAIAAYGESLSLLPGNILGWISAILAGVTALLVVLSIVTLPFNWWRQKKGRNKIVELLELMIHAYNELDATGPISATRFEKGLENATSKGVVWPAPLYVLVEDIKSKSGRF